jgi:hypothetical protein
MTVKNLESLVQRVAFVVANGATELRIGTKASGQTPASLSLSSPNYPGSNSPDGRPWHDSQDKAACRAGRPGSFGVVLRRSLSMRKPATLVARMHREQHPAALATVLDGAIRPESRAITAAVKARPTAQFGPAAGRFASTRGKRAG